MDISTRISTLAQTLSEGADALRQVAREVEAPSPSAGTAPGPVELTWRERLWICPAETRVGVEELAEALGKSRSWIYKRTQASAGDGMLPFRRLHGELTFRVGEIRSWLAQEEVVVSSLPMETTAAEARIIGRIGKKEVDAA